MVFKSSKAWNVSSDNLRAHLAALETPDQLYWDSRELKRDGRKFQSMDWSNWRRVEKVGGRWHFATAPETKDPAGSAGEGATAAEADSVTGRIRKAGGEMLCDTIKLEGTELDRYHGCGWSMVAFAGAQAVDIFYLGATLDLEAETRAFVSKAEQAGHEVWFGMLSDMDLCSPTKVVGEAGIAEACQFERDSEAADAEEADAEWK